ncbi:MAG: DUF4105 domain-containing protein [Elusimicrobiota bacterium]
MSEAPQWRLLLHADRSGKSEAEGDAFFLSPDGARDPEAELGATLASFFSDGQCRFTARYAWLKEALAFDASRLPEQACPDFQEWRGDPESLSLIFADAYLNDPSSMYGHTFLRVDERGRSEDEHLLDYALNFSAQTEETGGLLYSLRGLTGGYPGQFSIAPYYMRTQQYSNLESRDLWEYRLDLSSRAVDLVLRHIWELGPAHFDYYFLTKNCSYQLLPVLDAADPGLGLVRWRRLGVTPVDTLRALLSRPGLVKERRYRPSFVSEMLMRRSRLSREERRLARELGRKPGSIPLDGLPLERQAAVLDSAHDYFRYRNGFKKEKEPMADALLSMRGRIKIPSQPLPKGEWKKAPEDGHGTARVAAGGGVHGDGPFGELSWRAALHDPLARQDGYVPDSLLEMVGVSVRFDADRKVYLQKFDLANVVSLSPWDSWLRKPSWRLASGLRRAEELSCGESSCLAAELSGGPGLAARLRERAPLVYALVEAECAAGSPLHLRHRVGGGGAAGVLMDLGKSRVQVEFLHRRYFLGDAREKTQAELGWALEVRKDLELRVRLTRHTPHQEAMISLARYF